MRYLMILSLLAVAMNSVGCCGPMACGPGCGALSGGCYDCDGSFGPRPASGPIDALRQAKRSLVCGGGCGEVYYGEWISTPPHCDDPCCGDQFVGGAVRAQPFCTPCAALRPGNLIVGLYGKRFCDTCGTAASGDSSTGGYDDFGGGCSSCGGSEVIESPSPGTPVASGCSSCAAQAQLQVRPMQQSRVAHQAPPAPQSMARPVQRTAARTATTQTPVRR